MIRRGKASVGLCTLIAVTGLIGCARYTPAPVSLDQMRKPVASVTDLPSDVTSDQLLRLALAYDPAIAAARANLAAVEHDRQAAGQLPPVSASLSLEYSKEADASHPWLYGGAMGVPLDVGARRNGRITSADIAVLKARYALADTLWGVRQRLRQAQSDVGFAKARLAVTQRLLEQRQTAQTQAARLVSLGEESQGLLIQARLDASAAAQGQLQARAQYDLAEAALARALNVGVADVAALSALPEPQALPPEAVRIKTLGDQALYARGDIASALSDYDTAENDLRLAIAQQYPDLAISPGYTWERGVVKIPLGLSLNLPPLDGNRAHIEAAQARRLAAGKGLEDRVRTAQSDIDQAAQTYQADWMALAKIKNDDLPLARGLAQQAERRVRAGDLDQGAVLAAQIAETQEELMLLQAAQTALNDRLKLEDSLHLSLSGDDDEALKNALSEVTQ